MRGHARQNAKRSLVETKEIDVASNTKHQSLQRKYWVFTLGRDQDPTILVEHVQKWLKDLGVTAYRFQLEEGKETGYIHYQGWFSLDGKGKRLEHLRTLSPRGVHLEACRGKAGMEYASKNDTRVDGPWIWPYEYRGEDLPKVLYGWQQELLDELKGPVTHRKITWLWDPIGNTGKSTFCKYVAYHHQAMICGGELKDIAFAVQMAPRIERPIYIFDIPRSQGNHISYAALEALSNGMFFSPKYESVSYIGPRPHIVVFSNFEPDKEKLSMDRWNIVQLKGVTAEPAAPRPETYNGGSTRRVRVLERTDAIAHKDSFWGSKLDWN